MMYYFLLALKELFWQNRRFPSWEKEVLYGTMYQLFPGFWIFRKFEFCGVAFIGSFLFLTIF